MLIYLDITIYITYLRGKKRLDNQIVGTMRVGTLLQLGRFNASE